MDYKNAYLSDYVAKTLQLVASIRFKMLEAPLLMNEGVVLKNGTKAVDINNKTTWKWYMNASGLYHPSDEKMSVISIDTLEEIVFSSESLATHTATRKAYQKGTRLYQTLVLRYPSQKFLIDGILYPADMQKAIDAEPGEIISYRTDLVEPQEATLIQSLTQYIKNVMARWLNTQFTMSNDLYAATFYAILRTGLLTEVLHQRMLRARTHEVHSFHLRMYLSSHNKVGDYMPYLTFGQELWLYRNIRYIEHNAGKTDTFQTLIQKLLTDRSIPLANFSIRHQKAERPDYRSNLLARMAYLNDGDEWPGAKYITMDELFSRQKEITPGNQSFLEAQSSKEVSRFELAMSAATQTRFYDSSMIDYSNAVPETKEDVALRQWCHMANNDMYNVAIPFKVPTTGEFVTLMAIDAFVYMYYLTMSANGYSVDRIPEYLNASQRRVPLPTVDELMSAVPADRLYLREVATQILARQPLISQLSSVSEFSNLVEKLFDEAMWQWFKISGTDDMYDHGYIKMMCAKVYSTERTKFNTKQSLLSEWLIAHDLPTYNYSREEALELVASIFSAATGIVESTEMNLKSVQKYMIKLFAQLSSYPLQFVYDVNEDNILVLDRSGVRFGGIGASRIDRTGLLLEPKDAPQYAAAATLANGNLSDCKVTTGGVDPSYAICEVDVTPTSELLTTAVMATNNLVEVQRLLFNTSYEGQNVDLDREYRAIGYTLFEALPDSLKDRVKSHYEVSR